MSDNKRKAIEAVLASLIDVEPETPAELDEELREMGFDPEALKAFIENVVAKNTPTKEKNDGAL